jgi:hypothetical protein
MDGSARKKKRTLARKAARDRERDLRAAQLRLQTIKARRLHIADMVDVMQREGASRYPGIPVARALVDYYDREIEMAKEIKVAKCVFAAMYGPAQAVVGRDLAVKMLVRQGADQKEAEDYIDGLPVDEEEAE